MKTTVLIIIFILACILFIYAALQIENEPPKIVYFKDKQSGLCYAKVSKTELDNVIGGNANGSLIITDKVTFINVPCDSVKHLIK